MKLKKGIAGIVAAVAVGVFGTYNVILKETVDFTVTRSEFNENGDYSRYLVWGQLSDRPEVEIFKNTNTWLALKFNASDVFESTLVGADCTATVSGYRIPFLVIYRNILKIDCVES